MNNNKISIFKNKEDLYINFENNNDKFILITGISGSGKSSLACEFVNKNKYSKVSLDLAVFRGLNSKITNIEKKLISNFKKKYPEWKKELFSKHYPSKNDICNKWSNLFYDFALEFFYDTNTPVIIEGTHIYKYIDFEKVKDKKIIIKRTSLITSWYRSIKRTNYELKVDLKNKKFNALIYLKRLLIISIETFIKHVKWYKKINIFIEILI